MANQVVVPTASKTSVRKKKFSYEDGQADAREWLNDAHPFDVQELLESVGWQMSQSIRFPWDYCPTRSWRELLESKGRQYTFGFLDEVRNASQAVIFAFVYHRHHEGVQDGRRWASEVATEGQLSRLKSFSTDYRNRELFAEPYFFVGSWTPAHELAVALVDGNCPADQSGELLSDCREFREFWQPFVQEPLETLIPRFALDAFQGRHKLQDRHYVIGFIDGALGLSEQLGLRLSKQEVVR